MFSPHFVVVSVSAVRLSRLCKKVSSLLARSLSNSHVARPPLWRWRYKLSDYLLIIAHSTLRLLCCRVAAAAPRGREGGGRANRERSHRHYILSSSWQLARTADGGIGRVPLRRLERQLRGAAATLSLLASQMPDLELAVCMSANARLADSHSSWKRVPGGRTVRNYSERKVQRQPQCRAFFRSDAPLAACCMPSSRPASEQAVDGFACPRGASK